MTAPVVHRRDVEPENARPRAPGRPHVAVLVSLNFPDMTGPVASLVRRFTRNALGALGAADASYELLDSSGPARRTWAAAAAGADALFVLGGGDIAPSCYDGPAVPGPNSYGIDEEADRISIGLIRRYQAAGRPVLGICRGAQLINVAHGGSIIDDLADYRLHHGGPGEPMFVDEKIEVAPGTRLASLVGEGTLMVRSGHHQAVDRLGAGLVAAARATDGVIEAVEHPRRWTLGVQFHPEDNEGAGAAGRELRLLTGGMLAAARRSRNT